jgi:hypothetical protein
MLTHMGLCHLHRLSQLSSLELNDVPCMNIMGLQTLVVHQELREITLNRCCVTLEDRAAVWVREAVGGTAKYYAQVLVSLRKYCP